MDYTYKSITFGTFGAFGSGTWDVIERACDPRMHPDAMGDYESTTLGDVQPRSATLFFLWASLYSEPMSACSVALALGDSGIVRRVALPQALAHSSVLGRSLAVRSRFGAEPLIRIAQKWAIFGRLSLRGCRRRRFARVVAASSRQTNIASMANPVFPSCFHSLMPVQNNSAERSTLFDVITSSQQLRLLACVPHTLMLCFVGMTELFYPVRVRNSLSSWTATSANGSTKQ
eukprot:COSAG02_NODE_2172_length_9595_cov_9.363521_4_plen_231_part_00